jgi:esterase/lipase superfamily enzyme
MSKKSTSLSRDNPFVKAISRTKTKDIDQIIKDNKIFYVFLKSKTNEYTFVRRRIDKDQLSIILNNFDRIAEITRRQVAITIFVARVRFDSVVRNMYISFSCRITRLAAFLQNPDITTSAKHRFLDLIESPRHEGLKRYLVRPLPRWVISQIDDVCSYIETDHGVKISRKSVTFGVHKNALGLTKEAYEEAYIEDYDEEVPSESPRSARRFYALRGSVDDQLLQAEYTVWYGTNRKPNDPNDHGRGYSPERDSRVHLGSCRVFVPQSHKIGSIGSPWWRRILTLSDDRLQLMATIALDRDKFWTSLSDQITRAEVDHRYAVIFLHGFNVAFEDAAIRAAQIGFDLSIKGGMAFFSWPSQGCLKSYLADEASIEASEKAITEFITNFAERTGADAIHVIAHSMGNRGLLRAMNRILASTEKNSGKIFGQIILAAPDVDADVFKELSSAYTTLSHRTTLYVSQRDLAVEASQWLHEFPRAGLIPPVTVVPGIDTINVTEVDLSVLGHGYVAGARSVLHDMHYLIRNNASPEARFGLRLRLTPTGERYWQIGA